MLIIIDTQKIRHALSNIGITFTGRPKTAMLIISNQGRLAVSDISVPDNEGDVFNAVVEFKDVAGNVVPPDDVPAWTSSDETVGTLVVSDDGLTAVFTRTKKLGATVIAVDSINESGEDVHAQCTFTTTPSDVVSGEVTLTPAV